MFEKLIEQFEKKEFTCRKESDTYYRISKYTSAGQDWGIELTINNDINKVYEDIKSIYNSFDPSEEAYLWLDNTGHGKNGAPYEMIDVYNDMVECKNYINELCELVLEFVRSENSFKACKHFSENNPEDDVVVSKYSCDKSGEKKNLSPCLECPGCTSKTSK